MKTYQDLQQTISNYNYDSVGTFFHSFCFFCCPTAPIVRFATNLLKHKNLTDAISIDDQAALAEKIAEEYFNNPELKQSDAAYGKLIRTLTIYFFGYDVIDLCIQKYKQNQTIDTETFKEIVEQAHQAREAYIATYDAFNEKLSQINKYKSNIEVELPTLKGRINSLISVDPRMVKLNKEIENANWLAKNAMIDTGKTKQVQEGYAFNVGGPHYGTEKIYAPDHEMRQKALQQLETLNANKQAIEKELLDSNPELEAPLATLKQRQQTLETLNDSNTKYDSTLQSLNTLKQQFDETLRNKPHNLYESEDYLERYQTLQNTCEEMNTHIASLATSLSAFAKASIDLSNLDNAIHAFQPASFVQLEVM